MRNGVFDDQRLTTMGLLREVYEGLSRHLDAVHAQQELTGTDFDVLIRLARSPQQRLRMSDLAAQTALSTSGMTRIIDRLERKNLACRHTSPGDRRSSLAALTPAGYDLLARHVPTVADTIDRWLIEAVTPDQLAGLLDALRAIRQLVRPQATAGADDHADQPDPEDARDNRTTHR